VLGQICLREKAQAHPLLPCCNLGRAVDPQTRYRGPADWGTAHNLSALGSHLEMLLPLVLAWMEQADHRLTCGITAANVRGLIEIAGAAGQCLVRGGILTATSDRYDMFHLQGKVEHGFWRMAILTPMSCPERHLSIVRVHRPNASASAAARAADACNSAAMSASSSACSSAGRVVPWSRRVRQRAINASSRCC
jgi:hypothetical protein